MKNIRICFVVSLSLFVFALSSQASQRFKGTSSGAVHKVFMNGEAIEIEGFSLAGAPFENGSMFAFDITDVADGDPKVIGVAYGKPTINAGVFTNDPAAENDLFPIAALNTGNNIATLDAIPGLNVLFNTATGFNPAIISTVNNSRYTITTDDDAATVDPANLQPVLSFSTANIPLNLIRTRQKFITVFFRAFPSTDLIDTVGVQSNAAAAGFATLFGAVSFNNPLFQDPTIPPGFNPNPPTPAPTTPVVPEAELASVVFAADGSASKSFQLELARDAFLGTTFLSNNGGGLISQEFLEFVCQDPGGRFAGSENQSFSLSFDPANQALANLVLSQKDFNLNCANPAGAKFSTLIDIVDEDALIELLNNAPNKQLVLNGSVKSNSTSAAANFKAFPNFSITISLQEEEAEPVDPSSPETTILDALTAPFQVLEFLIQTCTLTFEEEVGRLKRPDSIPPILVLEDPDDVLLEVDDSDTDAGLDDGEQILRVKSSLKNRELSSTDFGLIQGELQKAFSSVTINRRDFARLRRIAKFTKTDVTFSSNRKFAADLTVKSLVKKDDGNISVDVNPIQIPYQASRIKNSFLRRFIKKSFLRAYNRGESIPETALKTNRNGETPVVNVPVRVKFADNKLGLERGRLNIQFVSQ